MPRINLIGSSNRTTNRTCVFGSMAGLPPTANIRPHITAIHGYKSSKVAANEHNNDGSEIAANTNAYNAGCGLGKNCENGQKCIKYLKDNGIVKEPHSQYYFKTGGGVKLLG